LRRHGVALQSDFAEHQPASAAESASLHHLPNASVADPAVADATPI